MSSIFRMIEHDDDVFQIWQSSQMVKVIGIFCIDDGYVFRMFLVVKIVE